MTIEQMISKSEPEIRQAFIAIVETTITNKAQRKTVVAELRGINSKNSEQVLQIVSRALGEALTAFRVPENFQELGMMEKGRILVRQREINEAADTCKLIDDCLAASKKGSYDLLLKDANALVVKVTENFDYKEYKSDAAINLFISLSKELLPGAHGQQTRDALDRELNKAVADRGLDLPTAMQTIGLLLQQKGQNQLGNDLLVASYMVF
ncbi:MAG: hypothetical protein ACHQUC_03440 [Chlamydiales bacterium]